MNVIAAEGFMHQPFFVPSAKSVKNTDADEAGAPRDPIWQQQKLRQR
jgi:hypothetical protein